MEGVINYARKEIKERIEVESKKIVGEVITNVMNRLRVQQVHRDDIMRTDIIFVFEMEEENMIGRVTKDTIIIGR
jgi:hypothetical protein